MQQNLNNDTENRPLLSGKRFYILIAAIVFAALAFLTAAAAGIAALAKYSGGKTVIEHRYEDEPYLSVIDSYKYNAVEIQASGSFGTAFVYTFDGETMYLITNRHVAGEEQAFISARFYGRNSFESAGKIEIVGYNNEYDIAVLKTQTYPQHPYADIRKENKIVSAAVQGAEILCLGNNLGYGIQAQNGIVSRDSLVKNVFGNVIAVVPLCAPLNSGNSGAAVYDLSGRLVGMNTWQVIENSAGNPVNDMCYLTPAPIIAAVFDNLIGRNLTGEASLPTVTMNEGNYGTLSVYDIRTTFFFDEFQLKVKSVEALGTRELKAGDVIKKFGDAEVSPCNYPSVLGELFLYNAAGKGKPLTLTIERGGVGMTVSLNELKHI